MSIRSIKNTNTIIDKVTGEILKQTEKTKIIEVNKSENEPEFIKIYLNTISKLRGLNNSQSKILFEIACRMPYAQDECQEIVLNSYIKKKIADKLEVSEQYINDTITKLVQEKLLIKAKDPLNPNKRTGAYYINPLYLAKGSWKEIKELQLKLVFNNTGSNITTVKVINKNSELKIIENPESIVV